MMLVPYTYNGKFLFPLIVLFSKLLNTGAIQLLEQVENFYEDGNTPLEMNRNGKFESEYSNRNPTAFPQGLDSPSRRPKQADSPVDTGNHSNTAPNRFNVYTEESHNATDVDMPYDYNDYEDPYGQQNQSDGISVVSESPLPENQEIVDAVEEQMDKMPADVLATGIVPGNKNTGNNDGNSDAVANHSSDYFTEQIAGTNKVDQGSRQANKQVAISLHSKENHDNKQEDANMSELIESIENETEHLRKTNATAYQNNNDSYSNHDTSREGSNNDTDAKIHQDSQEEIELNDSKEKEMNDSDASQDSSEISYSMDHDAISVEMLEKEMNTSSPANSTGSSSHVRLNETHFDSSSPFDETLQSYGDQIKDEIKFPRFYRAQGTLSLPFDGIVEPFEAWYAGDYNMSRIDYYYGMDKTFQRGDLLKYGVLVKVVPAHWGKNENLDKNTISCWYRPGFRWAPQRGQNILPENLKHFKFAGEEIRSGMPTLKYSRNTTVFSKKNSYTFYITKEKPHRPMRYIMHGYDTLLQSFYDHYVMDYLSFQPWNFDFKIMKIPKGTKCEKELSKLKSNFHFNPMAEFMHENFDDVDVDSAYEHYRHHHNKSYTHHQEYNKRKHIYRHNMRYIRSKNRAGLNYTLAPNEMTDITDEEFEAYKGLLIDPSGGDEALKRREIPEVRFEVPSKPLPDNLDWRDYNVVTPAKAQGRCGSCWTFSAMGPIEGALAIQTGKLADLAEQQLLDCSWGFGNYGCRGGFSWRALVWARKFGISTSKSYGRYLAQEGYCHCAKKDKCKTVKFDRVMTVPKRNENALRRGLARYGPASIAINVDRKSLKFYDSGVYDDPGCKPRTNHGVVIVGYGEENNKSYWIVKNSWGKFWGEEGFIKIARKNNQCGVLTNEPIFVKFEGLDDKVSKGRDMEFPFEKMVKRKFVDTERAMNISALKLSPFDYKRSRIDFWTPPQFVKKNKDT